MASNTANNINIDHLFIANMISVAIIFHIVLHGLCFLLNYVLNSGVYLMISNCARIKDGGNKAIVGLLTCIIMLTLTVGTIYDVKMVKLVRNRVVPIRMVSWQPPRRRSNGEDNGEIKDTIPVNATILSSVSLFL